MRRWIVMAAVVASAGAAGAQDEEGGPDRVTVRLVDGPSVSGYVARPPGINGLSLKPAPGPDVPYETYPWTRIAALPDGTPALDDATRAVFIASRLGAARARRGDWAGALEALTPLAARYSGSTSAQAHEIYGACVRASAVTGDTLDGIAAAVAPGDDPPPPWLDRRTGLDPGCPPVRGVQAERTVLDAITRSEADLTERDLALIGLYRILHEPGADPGPALEVARPLRGDAGVELCLLMATAQVHPDEEQRVLARARLRSRAEALEGTWTEAWCRLALGESLIREGDAESVTLGIVEHTHLLARFTTERPELARLALGAIERACLEHGRDEELARFRAAYDRTIGDAIRGVEQTEDRDGA